MIIIERIKNMKTFKTSNLWKRFLCGALSALMIFGGGRSPTTIYADTIEHTHIWATKYDDKNHWEYCTVCGEKRNVTAHVFTETKERTSTASCDHYIHYYSCKCGYHYMYKKPHQIEAEWHGSGSRLVDHKNCINCGVWTQQAACQDASGKKIGCNNPGTCIRCGYTATANTHVLSQGTCKLCKKVFFKETSGPTVTYSSDYKTCTITFTITPMDPSCSLTGAESYGWTDTPNWSSRSMSSVLNSDGSRTFTQKIIFNTAIKSKANIGYGNSDHLERINDTNVYESNYLTVSVWYDHQAPVQNDVILKDQVSANGWATIKQLTLSGTENNSDIIYLTISDKATGEKYVTDAAVPVTDGKYSYNCTPSIEGDANGRTYVVTAKDHMGNISTKEFVVSKTDGSYPQLKNGTPLNYTDWTTSKNISLNFFDFGAGGVEVSLDNQTDYKALTKSGEYYIWNHSFSNQVGTSEHTIYVRDALGNTGSYKLTVGNTDSNIYSISYNLNGGSLNGQRTSYTVADSFTLPIPTKTGYMFTGWTGSNGATPQKTVIVNKGTRRNLNYTANWQANNYYITFDGNGGSLQITDNSITKNDNGTATAIAQYNTSCYYALGIIPTRQGYTFKGFYDAPSGGIQVFKPYDLSGCLSVPSKYYNKNSIWKYTGNVIFYAQWQYNSVSVKVPQMLIGDHTGKSQFRVKCDSIAAGSIAVAPDSSFNYTQDKLSVKANIKRKSSRGVIDKNNHSVVYDIITDKPLTAGCWQGSFNVKLTLTKE